jgi:hypothetical protein
MMPQCCIASFVHEGIRKAFALARLGETHQCETCGRTYVLDPTWREIATPVKPLIVEEEDGE